MDIRDFGDALIRTRDLDPLYVGMVGARLDQRQLARYLLAYWCFYHVGAAAWLSEQEGEDYWGQMEVAARNVTEPLMSDEMLPAGRWPRAAERRHFRGQKCVDAVAWLQREYERPENPVEHLSLTSLPGSGDGLTDRVIMERVQCWPMFGPWISFKAADMMERVWGANVRFNPNLGLMYTEPRSALDLLWTTPECVTNGMLVEDIYGGLLTYFGARREPARGDRPCGPQEVETVLCKWKSMCGGHYYVGRDVHEHRCALAGWGETADRILRAYPSEVPAQAYAGPGPHRHLAGEFR